MQKPTDPLSRAPKALEDYCGSYSEAVSKVMDFGRALWKLAFLKPPGGSAIQTEREQHQKEKILSAKYGWEVHHAPVHHHVVDVHQLTDKKRFFSDVFLLNLFTDHLQEKGLYVLTTANNYAWLNGAVFEPVTLVRHFLGGLKAETDLRYFVRRDIRMKYGYEMSSLTAHFFHLLADSVNKRLEAGDLLLRADGMSESGRNCSYKDGFSSVLWNALKEDGQWNGAEEKDDNDDDDTYEPGIVKMFVECCRDARYLRAADWRPGYIRIETQFFDAEYLVSRLFGLPTKISGFDDLFGGGGLILSEDSQAGAAAAAAAAADADAVVETDEADADGDASSPAPPRRGRLNGRTILIKGRFGTGKSLLSMQLAVEVARKGGLAWIMPQEQTVEECLYALESMAVLPRDGSVIVAKTASEALKVLRRRDGDRGALIILNVLSKKSYKNFLDAFADKATDTRLYPLRVVSVDPINSISRPRQEAAELRALVFEKLKEVREAGTNIILVAEEESDPKGQARSKQSAAFEQNIADTVIHLSINKQQNNNYAQRYFEVTKSRYQREQRGEHAFSIVPGRGFRIFPSTAAVRARIYTRGASPPAYNIDIEPQSLTNRLGDGSVMRGDVIVFQGPSGTFKTPLGVPFVLGSDARDAKESTPGRRPKRSLFIATRDNKPTVERLFKEFELKYLKGGPNTRMTKKSIEEVVISPMRHGYVQPGYILQSLIDEFDKAELEDYSIDRVMIDNISHWEMSCPFIRDDEAFGNTLLDFLRRRRVTSLIICGEPSRDARSVLQQSIVDNADCVLRFSRSGNRGRQRIYMRVVKTHNIEAREDYFELIRTGDEIEFEPYSQRGG
ncbi:MAG: RAD55 family ATPase [Pyrinomonadaceae bacterium]